MPKEQLVLLFWHCIGDTQGLRSWVAVHMPIFCPGLVHGFFGWGFRGVRKPRIARVWCRTRFIIIWVVGTQESGSWWLRTPVFHGALGWVEVLGGCMHPHISLWALSAHNLAGVSQRERGSRITNLLVKKNNTSNARRAAVAALLASPYTQIKNLPNSAPHPLRQYSMCHLKQAQDGATHPPQRILSPSAKPQSNYAPRVKYGGAHSHPRPQPSHILNPYNDESSMAPHPLWVYYNTKRAAPAALLALLMVLSPSMKPNPENAQTMHHKIQEFSHSAKPPSKESADKARVKYRHVLSPSAKPNPENAQTMHHETQECTATQDPDSQVPTTHMMTKQVRCHTLALVDFLTLQNPCPKNPQTRPGRNTGMRAATQDPNSQLFATNTMRRPQIWSHTPAEAGSRHSWCPGIFGLWLRMKMWMPLPLATLHKELEGPHPSKLQSFSGINTVIIGLRGPPGFFNPILYPAAFAPPTPTDTLLYAKPSTKHMTGVQNWYHTPTSADGQAPSMRSPPSPKGLPPEMMINKPVYPTPASAAHGQAPVCAATQVERACPPNMVINETVYHTPAAVGPLPARKPLHKKGMCTATCNPQPDPRTRDHGAKNKYHTPALFVTWTQHPQPH
ncbi:hypothetical protein BS47DRAFT_1361906 [Hydnum rufescens UP504]|uniref:Uncharacterized protein n=1 Tax=Hydnum rufescens UP504 TaxID=1448309 RepID=A0A9P6AYQ6_9AGAM|nr:hypothetical protein BS47DRAFT_1361906 [Hydnum rufescens UP504]